MSEPAAKVAIDDVRKRVNGFALVHRLIFELDNDGTVDLNLVLDAVVLELRRNFTGDHRTVVMRVDVPSIKIDEDLAVAISLFAIEAVTGAMTSDVPLSCNSIAITVTVTRPASDRLRLSIADDGPERQINLPQHQQTIGDRLMNAFALQIARELPKYRREAGRTYLELDFQEKSRQLQSAQDALPGSYTS